ncbi:hypothetical protein [Streptomyces racemochromogenes]|uniref:hypothetical protein n=1 Tax=Streptomyces racemochromogenes TaxID=67353 RepID=UPI0031ED2D60
MNIWIRVMRKCLTMDTRRGADHAVSGDPRGGDQHALWALIAAILSGVASGAAQQAAAVLLGG